MNRVLSTLIILFFFNVSYAQNLVEAVKTHQQSAHFEYEPEIIRESKIESIEKVQYYLNSFHSSLDSGKVVNQLFFKQDGMPLRKVGYDRHVTDSTVIHFEYDSLNNLIKKSTIGKSTETRYQHRETDAFVWDFSGDTLTKSLYYYRQNNRMVLKSCDSIHYNVSDTSVIVRSNYREDHIGQEKKELFTFKQPQTYQLKFYSNGIEKRKHSIVDSVYIENYWKDSCGNINGSQFDEEIWSILLDKLNADRCSINELLRTWISAKSIRQIDDEIVINMAPGIITEGEMPEGPFGGSFLKIHLADSLVEAQYEYQGHYIFQDREEDRYGRIVSIFDLNLRLLKTKYFGSPADNSQVGSWDEYQYFDNGLVESLTKYNVNGRIISKTLYRLSSYN